MLNFSLHNHTYRCGHASGTEEEYILRAIKAGFHTFGFADHAPHYYPKEHTVVGRMDVYGGLDEYCEKLFALKEKYKGEIDIKVGLETEYFPAYHEHTMERFRACGVEYILLGQHMTANEGLPGARFVFHEDRDPAGLTKYIDQCIEGLSTGLYTYVAHPDVYNSVGVDLDFMRAEYDRLIAKAVELNLPLEINLLGLGGGRHYPSPVFWERAAKANAKAVLGCDAHEPDRVYHAETVEKGYRFADKYQIEVVKSVDLVRL